MSQLIEAIALGIVSSVLFAEVLGLSAAGLVVPGYVAYHLDNPVLIVILLLATFLILLFEYLIGKVTILYGRRLLAFDVLGSLLIVLALEQVVSVFFTPLAVFMDTVGYFIPALIVIYIGSQGFFNTMLAILLNTLLVRILLITLCRS